MLLVVGGHTRNIGKTSVAAALIHGIPEAGWIAVKITQYGGGAHMHGRHMAADRGAALDQGYALDEEREPSGSDSGRFLAAGARRSFWLRTPMGGLAAALPALQEILAAAPNAIVESNSVLEYAQPDLYLVVVDGSRTDCKDSASRFAARADALVIVGGEGSSPGRGSGWNSVPRRFAVGPPDYTSAELLEYVRTRL